MSPTLAAKLAPVPALKLRELGVYELPDQRAFDVSAVYAQGCYLYTLSAWKNFGVAEYWVGTEGQLISKGLPTQWSVEDLKDTGQTV